jgi:hypothetical protein
MAWRCRLGFHAWHIWCASMSGHQSYRERRCGRCLDRGAVVIDREPRGYFGGPVKGSRWEPVERRLIDVPGQKGTPDA